MSFTNLLFALVVQGHREALDDSRRVLQLHPPGLALNGLVQVSAGPPCSQESSKILCYVCCIRQDAQFLVRYVFAYGQLVEIALNRP